MQTDTQMLALLQQTALSVPHGLLPSHRGSLQHAETFSLLQGRLFRMYLYWEKCYLWLGGDGYLSKLKPGITHCPSQGLEIFLFRKKTKAFYSHC